MLKYLEIPLLIAVPAALVACAIMQPAQSALLSLAVVGVVLVLFFAGFERTSPGLRQIMPTVVLAALAAAGRILFAPIPDFKPVTAICIIAGAVFGRRCGFMVGALAALVSNFFFGQGPWTPWQMYAWGLAGWGAGALAQRGALNKMPAVCVYGFAASVVFGQIMNVWHLIGFVQPLTWQSALLVCGASLPLDILHGVATVVFLSALYFPWRKKLERVKRKFDLAGDFSRAAQ